MSKANSERVPGRLQPSVISSPGLGQKGFIEIPVSGVSIANAIKVSHTVGDCNGPEPARTRANLSSDDSRTVQLVVRSSRLGATRALQLMLSGSTKS